jgi:hypothetical protein
MITVSSPAMAASLTGGSALEDSAREDSAREDTARHDGAVLMIAA